MSEAVVKPGFKKSEVGVIPEDWDIRTLGSLTSLMTNGFVGKATSAYTDSVDGVIYIQGYNVEENSFNLDGIKRVSKSFHEKNQKSCLQVGDLLTIQTGDIGVTTVVPPSLVGANCHALVISRLFKNIANPYFFCYYFNSKYGRAAFKEIETGSTMKHLNVGDMIRIFVPLPPLPEQHAIAAALSDADGLLGALETLFAKKRAIKQAAMQQLLTGKTRLPGFEGEWETKRLGDIASIRNQKVIPSNLEPDLPCVELEHIGQGDGRLLKYSTAKYSTSYKYCFFVGDILFGRLRSYLRKFWLADRNGICTTEIWPLMVKEKEAVSGFLLAIVQSDQFIEIANISYGTHMPRADWDVVSNLEMLIPGIEEQHAIATVLSDMDAEILALEYRREKTIAIKEGMMQQLLTGKIRLIELHQLEVTA